VNYPVTNLWTFGTRYRIRNAHNKLLKNKENVLTPDEKREIFRDGLISAISASMNFDSTNSIVKPHRGLRSYIEGEYAGVGGDFYFTKFSYLNTLYMLLWPHGIIKYRFDLRSIWPIFSTSRPDQIPLSERFYLGGEGSVRGYKLFDLGNHFSNGDARGGLTSNVCSVEYLHELLPVLDAFLFVDAGSLSMKPARLRTFRMSWGGGVRVEVMNRMPMIIGMGFPANPGSHEEVQRFFFSMGGQF
jgi:outer membrane protein insertion porin family